MIYNSQNKQGFISGHQTLCWFVDKCILISVRSSCLLYTVCKFVQFLQNHAFPHSQGLIQFFCLFIYRIIFLNPSKTAISLPACDMGSPDFLTSCCYFSAQTHSRELTQDILIS